MGIADSIAALIDEMLDDSDGRIEIQRNEFARKLGYVPSQINYVITTRFTPERGYIIESRRGGGGYIRIIRKQLGKDEYLMHFFHAIGDVLDTQSAAAFANNLYGCGIVTERERLIITAALACVESDEKRAEALRQIIYVILK